jgi:hypothetical protein
MCCCSWTGVDVHLRGLSAALAYHSWGLTCACQLEHEKFATRSRGPENSKGRPDREQTKTACVWRRLAAVWFQRRCSGTEALGPIQARWCSLRLDSWKFWALSDGHERRLQMRLRMGDRCTLRVPRRGGRPPQPMSWCHGAINWLGAIEGGPLLPRVGTSSVQSCVSLYFLFALPLSILSFPSEELPGLSRREVSCVLLALEGPHKKFQPITHPTTHPNTHD